MKFSAFVMPLSCLAASLAASAATLETIPMQGGMVMPMIRYDSASVRLSVMLNPTVPQLTPLLVSNPADRFDAADPWFDLLDPGSGGYSFSRRYGFAMDTATDLLPDELQIWIRKLAGPAELLIYRYSSSAPETFEPVFGTMGAPNAMHWNGMMFHPVFAAAPGTNEFSATFEAYLVEAASGAELAGASTGAFTLRWTNVPDGRPEVALARDHESDGIILAWPAAATNYFPQSSPNLEHPNWEALTNNSALAGDRRTVRLPAEGSGKFFRMRRDP